MSVIPWLVAVSTVSFEVCVPKACKLYAGLAPGAEVAYEIEGTTGAARTLPAGGPLRFAVVGDTGKGTPAQLAVAAQLEKSPAQLILHTGDLVYPRGGRKDYDKRYFEPYKRILPRLAVYPTPGNHDYANQVVGAAYGRRRMEKVYRRIHKKPAYYSFDAGPAHFIALDVNRAFHIDAAPEIGPGSDQDAWLRRDLAASAAPWKLVYLHVPVHSTHEHGDHAALQAWLMPLFKEHGVQAVFQGHDHAYERTRPIGGTTYITVGTGGATLHPERDRPATDPWLFRLIDHGHLEVELDETALSGRFVDKDGVVRDRFNLRRLP